MQYRLLGKTKEKVSALGFGCMRFPLKKETQEIDQEETIKLLRYSIDQGVNYIDTAYPYHEGKSELIVGQALQDGYREKVFLADKLPSWLIQTTKDMEFYLQEQLTKCQTSYFDFYLVHALNMRWWEKLKKNGLFSFLDRIQKEGRVHHVGFSFHDEYPVFEEIVESYPWSFCQIQYNYYDIDYQAGEKGVEKAYEMGLGVIIMEPLRGGKLANNLPKEVLQEFSKQKEQFSPAEWAFRFLLTRKEPGTILSGMNQMEQLQENIQICSRQHDSTAEERTMFQEVRAIFQSRIRIPCTNCKYCLPCPHGVDIPGCFDAYNQAHQFANSDQYNEMIKGKASLCVECGECEEKCPQKLSIISLLKEVNRALSS